mgnify:CR=1 FL=1
MPVSTNPAPSAVTAALNEYHNNPLSPVATDSSVLDCSVLDSSVLVSSVVPWLFPPFPFESSVPGVGLGVGSGVGVGFGVGVGSGVFSCEASFQNFQDCIHSYILIPLPF